MKLDIDKIIEEQNKERLYSAERSAVNIINSILKLKEQITKAEDEIVKLKKELQDLSVETINPNDLK